ncbi:uncharacterized protein LOC108811192 [Raphanus sativus]|uniref:Uncharacterized protein LOC108811192 n=1 Tax=Raphanus sativus TaxID=3726 RepID=A0A6J0JSS6_RAPSA|nr:uncharacterized protein LOC108811192 [Raphanus sativus]
MSHVVMSKANEEKTHRDFRGMGQRLAEEVISFLKKKHARYGRFKNVKLSFVGRSIDNVIIRTALADSLMEPYREYLHTYLSLFRVHTWVIYTVLTLDFGSQRS